MDFLLVLIELFSLGVTTETLWAKIDRKSAISLQRGQFGPIIFQVEGDVRSASDPAGRAYSIPPDSLAGF